MMTQGFRPTIIASSNFPFVATVLFSKKDKGTLYCAIGSHADES